MAEFARIEGCRGCGSVALQPVMNFGPMPLADALLDDLEEADREQRFPLSVVFCGSCSLVQLLETVSPEILYGRSYPYYSSVSDHLVEHSRRNVETLIDRYRLGPDSLAVEIASNDGYLLQWFVKSGVPVLGIDPAAGPAQVARERGIPTVGDYFHPGLAEQLCDDGYQADIIIGNNVLAHVPDQNALISAMATLLAPSGSIVMEFPYVRDLIEKVEFDTIYHEHHCYFSVRSVMLLFEKHGLHLNTVERLPIHGGSLRVHFSRRGAPDGTVERLLGEEDSLDMHSRSYYMGLQKGAETIATVLSALLDRINHAGERVAAYAAAAKGAVLLNYCGIGRERLAYVVDRNPRKQGRYMPGVHLPIEDPTKLLVAPPEYLLILAWNFKDEIIAQQEEYSRRGGRFIVPVPVPRILAAADRT